MEEAVEKLTACTSSLTQLALCPSTDAQRALTTCTTTHRMGTWASYLREGWRMAPYAGGSAN